LSNIGVKKQLTILIVLAVIGFLALLGLGVAQTNRVYESANYGNENTVPSLIVIGKLNIAVSELRRLMYQHILEQNDKQKAEIDAKIVATVKLINDSFEEYKKLLSDEKDKVMLEEDMSAFQAYNTLKEKALAFSREDKKEEVLAAFSILRADAKKLEEAINRHIDYNEELGKKSSDIAVSVKKNAIISQAAIAIAVIIALIVIGVMMVKNIMRRLGAEPDEVAKIADQIAIGNTSVNINVSKNDTTSLMASMKTMADTIKALQEQLAALIDAVKDGKLNSKADADKFQGDFRVMLNGVNEMLAVINTAVVEDGVEALVKLAEGDFKARITTEYKNDYDVFKKSVNNALIMLDNMHKDTEILIANATDGKLTYRANTAQYIGGYKKIVEGVNNMLDVIYAAV
ncbi:MAG TPA: MCP four helix bundle domain-containing protein, partial [Campylobacterales bacterium]|nr:MCP four helix bundle domain-containing protein [Campylobacterales bacterium]